MEKEKILNKAKENGSLIVEKVANLIDVKSFITFAVIGGVTYGFITGTVTSETYAAFASSIITYYFTRKGEKE